MTVYPHAGVQLDLCQRCHGLWFDAGELRKVEELGSPSSPFLLGAPTEFCPVPDVRAG
jgi:Zn-finger nucleic acid-binding protein